MLYDIAIIGSGPAGLTAGIYAGRKKLKTVILTKQVGGQSLLTDDIKNFPGFEKISGRELIDKMRVQNENYGVEIREGEEIESIEKKGEEFLVNLETRFPTGNRVSLTAKAIIIATGKSPRRLGIPREKEFEGRGVVFCSICDAPLFEKKEVAIIGSGNSGLTAALDLLKYANKIYILESLSKITGDELLVEKLKQTKKVEFIVDAEIKEIKGNKFVESIVYSAMGGNKELPVNGVFVNIGWIPATGFLKGFLELNENGEVIINPETNETLVKGVFAAGDCTNVKYKQCIIAAGEGAKASLSAYQYLMARYVQT